MPDTAAPDPRAVGAHDCPRCGEPYSLDGCGCPTTTAAKRCGHKHHCACGLGLPMRQHSDPNYSRQGFCDRPCAYCDSLDAEEAERGY